MSLTSSPSMFRKALNSLRYNSFTRHSVLLSLRTKSSGKFEMEGTVEISSEVSETLEVRSLTAKTDCSLSSKRHKSYNNKKQNSQSPFSKESPKKPKSRPNYFIGVRITNANILEKLRAVQEHVKSQDNQLTKACVPIPTSHVTLAVMHLEGDSDVERASEIFQECGKDVSKIISSEPLKVTAHGIGNFNNTVVFAKLEDNENLVKLSAIAELLRTRLKEFIDQDEFSFKAHLTLMKLSKMPKFRKPKVKKIAPGLYQKFVDVHFGTDTIASIQLLSMMKKKQADGYYFAESTVALGAADVADSPCSRFCLEAWAERLAVDCVTLAVVHQSDGADSLQRYITRLADDLMRGGLSEASGASSKIHDASNSKLIEIREKFREKLGSEETKQQLRKELSHT